jgi:hypothetical protein
LVNTLPYCILFLFSKENTYSRHSAKLYTPTEVKSNFFSAAGGATDTLVKHTEVIYEWNVEPGDVWLVETSGYSMDTSTPSCSYERVCTRLS